MIIKIIIETLSILDLISEKCSLKDISEGICLKNDLVSEIYLIFIFKSKNNFIINKGNNIVNVI
jgi:hypothetical protein